MAPNDQALCYSDQVAENDGTPRGLRPPTELPVGVTSRRPATSNVPNTIGEKTIIINGIGVSGKDAAQQEPRLTRRLVNLCFYC